MEVHTLGVETDLEKANSAITVSSSNFGSAYLPQARRRAAVQVEFYQLERSPTITCKEKRIGAGVS